MMDRIEATFIRQFADDYLKMIDMRDKIAKTNEKMEKEYEYQGLKLKSAITNLDRYIQKYGAIESEEE